VCKRLWTEDGVEHHGAFFDFPPVAFEPKPVQRPWPPLLVGGESEAALRRAARAGDGWIGLDHTPESVTSPLARLRALRAAAVREREGFAVTVGAADPDAEAVRRFEELGVDRLIVSPWRRSREALDALRRTADRLLR
jgi:alkanesulfonate monooxygenase SsuD/methylene tetrahydromethanopterin reductase-like flavin-dependent oxidoreductase (luciferase family)